MGGTSMIPGGVIDKPAPLAVSKVMVVCPTCNLPTRVGHVVQGDQGPSREGAGLQARGLRGGARQVTKTKQNGYAPRLRSSTSGSSAPRLQERARPLLGDAGPARDEDHPEHGRRRREDRGEGARQRDGGAVDDRRAARADAPGPQVDRRVQAARGDADRRPRDAARRAHVRVPRPARLDRAAAHPRLPRSRPGSFDGRGNYSLGIREQIIFPEINYDESPRCAVSTSPSRRRRPTTRSARALLRGLGLPFADDRREAE